MDDFEAKEVRMTRKYRLERTAFIGCRNTAYMDVDDAEPCPFCGSRQVTIYPYGQGTTSYVEGVPTLYLSSATCKCRGCTAEIDGPQRKSIIEGEDEYNACIAALKTWNTRYSEKRKGIESWALAKPAYSKSCATYNEIEKDLRRKSDR